MRDGPRKVLITGITSPRGRRLARRLASTSLAEVCGVDRAPWTGPSLGFRVHRVELQKRRFEDVVRTERPDAIVHMGLARDLSVGERRRYDINVRGTRKLFDHCVKYGVEQLVVMSSYAVYGAHPDNPYFIDEDFPLTASRDYPQIRDQVEVDTLSSTFMWQHPEIHTCVLRPVGVLGPKVDSMIAKYLELPRVPTVMGFDPMMQFIAEEDLCDAIVAALKSRLQGVFNVAGPGEVPVHTMIEQAGAKAWPVPEPVLRGIFERMFDWGMWRYPPGVLDYLKYPVCVLGDRFNEAAHFQPRVSLREIFASMRNRR
jgi:UDP-glucose 4-epimerase